ncbi:hypothetical protein [Streptomyces chryseus]
MSYETADWIILSYKGLDGTPVWILIGILVVCITLAWLARSKKK